MTRGDYTENEIEAQVGYLLCVITVGIEYSFYYRDARGYDPAEEELTIIKDEILETLYFIDGEEVSEVNAHQYYNDYFGVHYEEHLNKKLEDFLQTHVDIEKERIALEHLQDKNN